ncbi:hypothetical protein Pla110_17850 [Polystyrenella longa]|uniref:Phosphate ABC transporter substrate-binding protein n=1 Tax=Polystyrenella longa TaxID=2528007 RepID=A0A518CLI2_9PLAN|nr:phosphate ABC transporter substrate-binding protein [Polystyrenella longa]QDU80063.1 hypothetical protein Pla110_17850 [Polystyrenella longa]
MHRIVIFIVILVLLPTFGFTEEKEKRSEDQSAFKQDIVGLWLMGQSLCEGAESLPIVTSSDSGWGNYQFKRGVRTWLHGNHANQPEDRPEEQFTFVPLTAATYGGLGETIANGLADHLKARLNGTDQSKENAENGAPHFLTTYAGQGGRLIDELSSVDQSNDSRTPANRQHGGHYYQTSLDDARRARAQADSMGKSFSIAALVWMQGEANGGPTGGINPSRWGQELKRPLGQEWYRDRLIHFRKEWSQDLQAITGQTGDIPMFTYQTLGPAGDAQLMAADTDPNITMVGPHYSIPSGVNSRYAGRYGDPIHMSADGERWYGEQVAKVVHRVIQEGEKWQPLRPRKASIAPDRKSVLVDFSVPRPPLVLDELFLPREQYPLGDGFHSLYGFQIRDADKAVIPISSITVESSTVLRIELIAALEKEASFTLSYGLPYAGQIGNITSIRKGPIIADQPTTELLVEGKLDEHMKPLLDEGAFIITNMLGPDSFARVPVRHVNEEEGTTVLRYVDRERRNNLDFAVGQTITTQRPFTYGNLRDSDPEKSIYQFADPEYGTRAGQPYPLWNWCVLFNRFPISE